MRGSWGSDKGEFSLVTSDVAKTLMPTESENFTVIMSAHSNGDKLAQLSIETSTGPIDVDLDGSVGGSIERETYYACAVGGAAALWPIGLALLALLRRRR